MNRLLLWFPVVFTGFTWLQDSTPVAGRHEPALWVNQKTLKAKDTFSFHWNGMPIGKAYPVATLHIWADHIESGRRWKFRYPILNGIAEGDLALADSLPPGTYAFNFMASEQFFSVNGRIKKVKVKTALNHKTGKRDTVMVYEYPKLTDGEITYHLLGKEAILLTDKLAVGPQGEFRIPPVVFGDSAQLVLNPAKGKGSYWIDIETPLDSTFTPFYSETVFVRVTGSDDSAGDADNTDTSAYSFEFNDPRFTDMLPEVRVTGKSNQQKFEDDFVSYMFRNQPGVRTFEGLDSDEITRTNDIFMFLRNNVAGLILKSDGISRSFTWRGDPVQFFLNEFPVTADALANVAPMDVALIKAYPPPAQMQSLVFGGAVAVYTKRGAHEKDPSRPRYHFIVRGFTQGESAWGN
jgi:hypothetical protein